MHVAPFGHLHIVMRDFTFDADGGEGSGVANVTGVLLEPEAVVKRGARRQEP